MAEKIRLEDRECPLSATLGLVGEWWTLLILHDAFDGYTRFDEFQANLGISSSLLTSRLKRLVANGLLERRQYQEHPPRHEYVLTDLGRSLRPVIVALAAWGNARLAPDRTQHGARRLRNRRRSRTRPRRPSIRSTRRRTRLRLQRRARCQQAVPRPLRRASPSEQSGASQSRVPHCTHPRTCASHSERISADLLGNRSRGTPLSSDVSSQPPTRRCPGTASYAPTAAHPWAPTNSPSSAKNAYRCTATASTSTTRKALTTRTRPRNRSCGAHDRHEARNRRPNTAMLHRPNAHATISGNSSCQNASPCDPTRSVMTTSAPASRSASAHRVAFSRKNGSSVPATRYVRGSRARHHARRSVTPARRGGEDRTVDVRMPKPDGERQLATRRDTEHRGALGGQRDAETRPRPSADVLDEEPLVCREPFRVEAR